MKKIIYFKPTTVLFNTSFIVIGLRCKKCLWMESDDLNIQHLIDNTVDETLLVDCLDEPQNVGHEECTRDEDVCVYTIVYTTHTVYTGIAQTQ